MQLKDLVTTAIIIIVTIFVLFAGAKILTNTYKNQVATIDVVNETITGSSTSYVSLTYTLKSVGDVYGYDGITWNLLSSPADYNVTLGNLETGNKGGIIVSSTYDGQSVKVNYVGYKDTYASNISKEGINASVELSNWTPTIAIVIAAAVIIGIVLTAFAFGKKK